MTSRVLPLAVVTGFALALSGCASTANVESTETSTVPTVSSGSSSSSSENSTDKSSEQSGSSSSRSSEEPRRTESSETVASKSSSSSSSEGPRSTWRSERDSQRDARSSSVGASGDSAKLVEQLNDASRELATLRAQNAKLRAERDRPAPASSTSSSSSTASGAAVAAAKADPADEKLAASLKSYAQFKQEMVTIFADVERMRKENAGMSANLKAAVEQVDHARATIAKLEMDLRTERKSRADAEYAASQLRDQLRTIARALNSAGLSVDKISSATETASR